MKGQKEKRKAFFALSCGFSLFALSFTLLQDKPPKEQKVEQAKPIEQNVKFAPKFEKGQKFALQSTASLEVAFTTKDNENQVKTKAVVLTRKERVVHEILAAEKGLPTEVKLLFVTSSTEKSGTDYASSEVTKTRLDGRTFVVKHTAAAKSATWQVEPDDAFFTPDVRQFLGWLKCADLLPDKEAKPGDKWNKPFDCLGNFLNQIGESQSPEQVLQLHLKELKEGKATIELTASTTVKTKEGSTVKLNLTGAYLFDTQKGLPVSVKLAGALQYEQRPKDAKDQPLGEIQAQSKKLELNISFEEVK